MIGVPRTWCVGLAVAGGVELRRGVWRTALGAREVRDWIDSIDHIERRGASGGGWVDWSKDNLWLEGARAVSRFIGAGARLRFWRKPGDHAGCPVVDGALYEQVELAGVMVFHADRPDWWIPLLNSQGGT